MLLSLDKSGDKLQDSWSRVLDTTGRRFDEMCFPTEAKVALAIKRALLLSSTTITGTCTRTAAVI